MALYRSWSADIDAHGFARLPHIDNFVVEQHFHVRELLHSFEEQASGLELLALNDKRMPRILREDRVVEFRNKSIGRSIPKLKDRRNQAYPCHVLSQAIFGQQIECCGVRRGRARVSLQAVLVIEQANRDALAAQVPSA